MTSQVDIHEAETHLAMLLQRVMKSEETIIAKAGKPCLDLVPHREDRQPRKPGRLKGQIEIAPDFDRTPDELIDAFEGE